MRLVAVKIGAGVPSEPFSGHVRSVFANAAILKVANTLITLAPEAAGGLPSAISLEAQRGLDFAQLLTLGAPIASRGGVLRLADNAGSIDLRQAYDWRSRLRELAVDLCNIAMATGWATAARVLRTDGRCNAIASLGHDAIVNLGEAARRFDLTSAERAAERLVGLGAGGTPAGDDLLVGHLAGLWSSVGDDGPRADFASRLADILRRLGNRTNDVSRVYLEAVADGEVSERLADLASGIAAGEGGPSVAEAAAAAMSVGHSSGADGTLGLLLGLASWGPDPIFCASRRLV